MKKIISIALVALMALTALASCGEKEAATVNFGMGVYAAYGEVTSADGDTNGAGEVATTVAAVLVDADGKIVKCDIDTVDLSATYTSAGKVEIAEEFKTKAELGTDYGMAAYGTDLNGDGKVLEWNEQIDALEGVIAGKTIDEVKALVADGYYGTEDVQTAGCTIGISDYVKAVEKAVANAVASEATAEDNLKVAMAISAGYADATEGMDGNADFEITVAAAASKDGKVTAAAADAVAATISFDEKGASLTDTTAEIKTKVELGTDYGMAAYGTDNNEDGKVLEWNEQAAVFNAQCVGKTADEIAALVVDGYYGTEEVQTAGCTMGIVGMADAVVKAVK